MYLKKFLMPILLVSKLSTVNASFNCIRFPENFETNHPENYQLLQTLEISPKAVKLFKKVKAEHGILNVMLTYDCKTNGYYIQGSNTICISEKIINAVDSFCETFIWEVCNAVNPYLKKTLKFKYSKDEYAFFTEAAEHKSCVKSIKILEDYFKKAINNSELKELIENVCGQSLESIIEETKCDPNKSFKSYWKSVNELYTGASYAIKILHAQLYRDQCNIDLKNSFTFTEDREFLTKIDNFIISSTKKLSDSISNYHSQKKFKNFTDAVEAFDYLYADQTNSVILKMIRYAFSSWAWYEQIPHLSIDINDYYKSINDNSNGFIYLFHKNYDLINKGFRHENPAKVYLDPVKFKENSERFAARAAQKKTVKQLV